MSAQVIQDAIQKATGIINNPKYEKGRIYVSVSGGSDSDETMDVVLRVDHDEKVRLAFFNTGVEYRATLEHLDYLENKYNRKIDRVKPVKTIPTCVREYGVPIISKMVSEHINRLQRHGFKFEDRPYEELAQEYSDCLSSVKWWCNEYPVRDEKYGTSMMNINRNRGLKEFIVANGIPFKVSNKCCEYAKKASARQYERENNIQLSIFGIRKSEGGRRAIAYKSCFMRNEKHKCDLFMPVFWFTDEDKQEYDRRYGVTHSRCYTEYGLKRTGCAGCPYNIHVLDELGRVKDHEPLLCTAANTIFADAYAWTKEYRQYQEMRRFGFSQLKMF